MILRLVSSQILWTPIYSFRIFEDQISDNNVIVQMKLTMPSHTFPISILEKLSASISLARCLIQDESVLKQLEACLLVKEFFFNKRSCLPCIGYILAEYHCTSFSFNCWKPYYGLLHCTLWFTSLSWRFICTLHFLFLFNHRPHLWMARPIRKAHSTC